MKVNLKNLETSASVIAGIAYTKDERVQQQMLFASQLMRDIAEDIAISGQCTIVNEIEYDRDQQDEYRHGPPKGGATGQSKRSMDRRR